MRLDLLSVTGARPSRCLLWDRFRAGRLILEGVRRTEIESVKFEAPWDELERVEKKSFKTPPDTRGEEVELDAAPAGIKLGEDVAGPVVAAPGPRFKIFISFSSLLISARTSHSAVSRSSTESSMEERITF